MKNKITILVSIVLLSMFLISSCTGDKVSKNNISQSTKNNVPLVETKGSGVKGQAVETNASTHAEQAEADMRPMVKVNGEIYLDMGYVNSTITCGTPDGKILTSVDGTKTPEKDDESNFGIGYEYQYSTPGYLNVKIDGRWSVFQNIAMDVWPIPEGVANFTADVIEIAEDRLIVSEIDVPQDFAWIFDSEFNATKQAEERIKAMSLPIDNLEYSKDGKTITTEGLINKRVKVWFDGTLENTEPEVSSPAELGQVYRTEVIDNGEQE